MRLIRLQLGTILDEPMPDGQSEDRLEKDAMLVYVGSFESMDGPVEITPDHLSKMESVFNGRMKKLKGDESGEIPMKDCPPVQLDHSVSAVHTVGRLIGPLSVKEAEIEGRMVPALFGRVRILGTENVEKVRDGRWTHLSIGADLESGRINELTITPFPAAPNASMLGMNPDVFKIEGKKIEIQEGMSSTAPDKSTVKMPGNVDEAKWEEAKKIVKKEYPEKSGDDFWKIVQGIYKNMSKKRLGNPRFEDIFKRGGVNVKDADISATGFYVEVQTETDLRKAKDLLRKAGYVITKEGFDDDTGWTIQGHPPKMGAEGEKMSLPKGFKIEQDKKTGKFFIRLPGGDVLNGPEYDTKEEAEKVAQKYYKETYLKRMAKANWSPNNIGGEKADAETLYSDAYRLDVNPVAGDQWSWIVARSGQVMGSGKVDSKESAKKAAMQFLKQCEIRGLSSGKKKGVKLSEGGKMDKEKLKKHLMEKMGMKEEEAEKHLAGMGDEEMAKMAATIDEETSMAAEADQGEGTTPGSKEADQADGTVPGSKEADATKMSAAKTKIIELHKGFKVASKNIHLAAKKAKIGARLSKLRSEGRLTPGEIKGLDVEKIASLDEQAMDVVLSQFSKLSKRVDFSVRGTTSAVDIQKVREKYRLARLEVESRLNMPSKREAAKAELSRLASSEKEEIGKLQGGESESERETNIHIDTTPHVDMSEKGKADYESLCKMMDEGKDKEEVKAALKKLLESYGVKHAEEMSEGSEEGEKRMSSLASEFKTLETQFKDLVGIVGETLGVESKDLAE